MKNNIIKYLASFLIVSSSYGLEISEDTLINLKVDQLPELQKIEASQLQSMLEYESYKEKFIPQLYGNGSYQNSDEKAFINFMPTTQRANAYKLGVKKTLSKGIELGGEIFTESITNDFLNDATTNGAGFNLSMDLNRNFLGRIDDNQLKLSESTNERSTFQKKIHTASFKNTLRKLYWSLVANNESRKITNKLLETAKKSLSEVKSRYKNKVADRGELARYQALVSSRKSSLISLEYRKDALYTSLKELVPSFAEKTLQLGPYNIDKTIEEVRACSLVINAEKESPFKNTFYDEMIALINKEEKLRNKIIETHSGADVKLVGSFEAVGRALGRQTAFDDFQDDTQRRYTVGLQLNMPLGSQKKKNEKIQSEINRIMSEASRKEQLAKIKTYHHQIKFTISHLFEALKNQKTNSNFLEQSLKVTRKKYRQARVSTTELIQEEETYFQSRLDEIQTNLTAMHTLLDYFSVYQNTPCEINRI